MPPRLRSAGSAPPPRTRERTDPPAAVGEHPAVCRGPTLGGLKEASGTCAPEPNACARRGAPGFRPRPRYEAMALLRLMRGTIRASSKREADRRAPFDHRPVPRRPRRSRARRRRTRRRVPTSRSIRLMGAGSAGSMADLAIDSVDQLQVSGQGIKQLRCEVTPCPRHHRGYQPTRLRGFCAVAVGSVPHRAWISHELLAGGRTFSSPGGDGYLGKRGSASRSNGAADRDLAVGGSVGALSPNAGTGLGGLGEAERPSASTDLESLGLWPWCAAAGSVRSSDLRFEGGGDGGRSRWVPVGAVLVLVAGCAAGGPTSPASSVTVPAPTGRRRSRWRASPRRRQSPRGVTTPA